MAFTVATRDPSGPLSLGVVAAGAAVAVGALAAAALVALATRATKRGARRDAAVARSLRRGATIGCAFGLLTLLRALDGLTPLTAIFVVAPFVVAEAVLSTQRG